MGNSQPSNRTGSKQTAQKLENAKKIGVLSLCGHGLEDIPPQVFDPSLLKKLRTLDLSKNKLKNLRRLGLLQELKSFNADENCLSEASLSQIPLLLKLQSLSLSKNRIGKPAISKGPSQSTEEPISFPELPPSIKQLNLSFNSLSSVPRTILSKTLERLEKLDLSSNNLATVPPQIVNLINLQELRLDSNVIVSLPEDIGRLAKLKALSLKSNKITVSTTHFTESNPQPLPSTLFTSTSLIDLNLHGNALTNTQLNEFKGFDKFLNRRQKVKSKMLTNLEVCGLE